MMSSTGWMWVVVLVVIPKVIVVTWAVLRVRRQDKRPVTRDASHK